VRGVRRTKNNKNSDTFVSLTPAVDMGASPGYRAFHACVDPILLITVPCSRATHSARRSVSALDGTPRNLNQQHRPDRSGCWLRRRRFRDQNIFVKLVLTILWRARSDQGSPLPFAPPILNGTPIVGVTVPFTKTSVGRANICQRHRPISIFLRGENPAVYGVDDALRLVRTSERGAF